jgi:hypothetical protein
MRIPGLNQTLLLPLAVAATVVALAGCGSSSEGTQTVGAPGTGTTAPPANGAAEPPAQTSTTPQAPTGVRARRCTGVSAAAKGEVRVTGVSCAEGASTVTAWRRDKGCSSPSSASRTSCKVHGLTCLGAVTDRGIAVTCAGPGHSIAFVGRRG